MFKQFPYGGATRMAIKSRACGFSILLAMCGPIFAKSDDPLKIATAPFLSPAGPFAVGTHEYLWIDQNRQDPFTKDPKARRHLIVRVWYPAVAVAAAEKASYIREPNEFAEKSTYGAFVNVKTNAVANAPLVKSKGPFPVLVYQPGGGTQRFIGTFETEELASHGYVIVSADHPGFSETVLFPDGVAFKPDQHLAPAETGDFRKDVENSWGWLNDEVFPTWIADASFTLDKIEELNKTSGQIFYHQLDLTRIGMFGWSFGGATSVEMSIDDPRVKAVVDQDGQLFGAARKKGTSRPLMLMHHGGEDKAPKPEQQAILNGYIAQTEVWDRSMIDHSTNDRYEVSIAKTQHGHFSDFMLAIPPDKGELDARRGHAIVIAYTLAFFDKYLRGQDSDLLKGPSAKYPEVTFKETVTVYENEGKTLIR
jgi:predicted dienelactone hydrolase